MTKRFLITVGIMGALCVLLGAVGSHFLDGNIPEKHMKMFEIANQFLMFHTLALLALTFMNRYVKRSYLNITYYMFLIGTIIFSGTLFLASLKEVTGFGIGALGKLTPLGGLLLIIGWLTIIVSGMSYQHKKRHG